MTTCSLRSRSFFSAVLAALIVCAAGAQEAALTLSGVSETAFNPLAGTLTAHLTEGTIATDDDAVRVFVNDVQLDADAVTVRDRSVLVDYKFVDGVNDVLILARGDDGRPLRGDALLWAGEHTLVVDVVNSDLNPVPASVRVALASDTSVRVRHKSDGGAVRFTHLPAAGLVVRARTKDGEVSAAIRGDAGSLLLTLGD